MENMKAEINAIYQEIVPKYNNNPLYKSHKTDKKKNQNEQQPNVVENQNQNEKV